MTGLLALADKTPNADAVAISPTIGWLMLAAAVCVALVFILHAEKWRRWWLTAEDPRGIAVFRIVFTFFVISNINGMWEFFEYLYTDEGIFTADVARQVFAREQFAGFGDGLTPDDPWGFYDWDAFVQFLQGPKYSLLFFWDSPTFFWAHLWAFEICAVFFMIGFRTRLMGVLTWFLMNGILVRNHLAWEGTELVYRVMLVYLVMARSGHAYSVDNWLRCRRLRKQGLLSERDGPGGGAGVPPSEEHPKGLQPVYRLIPSWPRKLVMLQLATIYITTGALKTGSVWLSGDSLYYALNLDHFYRLPPQYLASLAGTSVFRAMTWAVKVGQTGFSLILFGIVARWIIDQKFAPLSAARQWASRAVFAGLILSTASIIYVAYPVHFTPPISAELFAGLWIALWAGLWLLWRKLTFRPFVVRRVLGRTLQRPVVIDRTWVCRWILGRRVLLVWHLAFHAHIFTLMNVGQFQTGMLACTFAFLQGHEIATLLRDVGHRLARVFPRTLGRLMPRSVVERLPIIPAADPSLPQHHRDAATLPLWALMLALGGIVAGVLVQVRFAPSWDFRWVWVGTAGLVAVIAWSQARRARGQRVEPVDPQTEGLRAPWGYGAFGRLVVGGLIAWQLSAVAAWLLPDKDCLSSFRPTAHKAVRVWLQRTTTDQGWGMFAPNPPRSNVFLKVLVTDDNDQVWDLKTDVYADEQKPIPWIWNTRLRKMNRRIIGGESGPTEWYRKWYARYECRQWAREHDGQMPKKIELVKVWYSIPSPEQTRQSGYYVAEDLLERSGHEKVSYTAHCAREVQGQLPNFIRERDGLPLLEEGEYKAWHKNKHAAWEKRK
ncbi:MAG: hypothetical protein KDK70_19280 [Myxococcales bacterium]|nr:hypothetical protein [Myxococcales bacterium]